MRKLYSAFGISLLLCACSGAESDSGGTGDAARDSHPVVAEQQQALGTGGGSSTPSGSPSFADTIKAASELASKLSGYYSYAKTAFDVATKLGEMMGILAAEDPDAKFKEILNAVQQAATTVDWKVTKTFIDTQLGQATWALGRLQLSGGQLPEGGNEDQSSGSAVDALALTDSAAFYRPYNDAQAKLIENNIKERPEKTQDGQVYDWRLGVPVLLQLISYRIQIIAAMDPNFRFNHRYDPELTHLRDAVQFHYDKMIDGIKCGGSFFVGTALDSTGYFCQDIYTGIEFNRNPEWEVPQSHDGSDIVFPRLRSKVMRAMPLFQMRKTIDALNLYLNKGQDLTQANGDIRSLSDDSLCIDAQWGNPNPQTPVWSWGCNWDDAQWWVYDRQSGQIHNPAYDLCLDVAGADVLPGTAVQTWGCNGTDAQLWSWDPLTSRLQNALGTVLNLPSDPVTDSVLLNTVPPGTHPAGEIWEAAQGCTNLCDERPDPGNPCDSSCQQQVCAADDFCCNNAWDGTCVGEVTSICGLKC